MERLIVIGADAAGMSAASKARRMRKDLEIVAYDRGGFASYGACGLPYWVGGEIETGEKLVARTPAQFAKSGIDVHLHHEVLEIDPAKRRARVRALEGGRETWEAFDHLLLATGARPIVPPLPGMDLDGVYVLKTMEDGERLHAAARRARRAVVIGGGYIGVEVAENLRALGLQTHVVEMVDQVLPNLDPAAAELALEELKRHEVAVHLNTRVEAVEGRGRVERVITDDGVLEADLVVVAVGVRPNSELARQADVPCGAKGAIVTDDRMATGTGGIWAAGDCCQAIHRVIDQPTWIPLGDTANRQGRVAGTNLGGGDARFRGVVGTAITRVFDRGFGRTGLSRREAEVAGLEVEQIHVDARDQAHYMPHPQPVRVVLTWERKTGRLVGGAVVGQGQAVKRIDALAVAVTAGWTVEDLAQADLAYAPPFSPVWDPLLVAANVAGGG